MILFTTNSNCSSDLDLVRDHALDLTLLPSCVYTVSVLLCLDIAAILIRDPQQVPYLRYHWSILILIMGYSFVRAHWNYELLLFCCFFLFFFFNNLHQSFAL